MARSRNLKPGFFINDELAETEPLTRLLAVGLPCIADRVGRFEYRPMRIKAQLLPFDNHDIEKALFELQRVGFVVIYEHKERRYVQIINFEKHQSPHINEAESVLPGPLDDGSSIIQVPYKHGTNPPDSLNLIPDSLNPIGRSVSRFDDFWNEYPKKVGKRKTKEAWQRRKFENKRIDDETTLADVIIEDVKDRKENDQKWIDGYVPNPLTYINGDRWEDDKTTKKPKGIPTDEDSLLEWGKQHGIYPGSGETWKNYRARCEQFVEKELRETLR